MNIYNRSVIYSTFLLGLFVVVQILLYTNVYNTTFSRELAETFSKLKNAGLHTRVALRKKGMRRHKFLNQTLLDELTKGYWKPKYVTDEYKKYVIDRVKRARDFNNMEYSKDTKCGHETGSFRTVCNPADKKACCKENTCQDIPIENCTCPTCYDERPRMYPEFYDWTPYRVHIRSNISGKDICTCLRNLNVSSMIIFGDSLFSQFINNFRKRVVNETKAEHIQSCHSLDRDKEWRDDPCMNRSTVQICNQVKFLFLFEKEIHVGPGTPKDIAVINALREMKKDTVGQLLVLTDIGLWTNLNTQTVSIYLEQLLKEANSLGDTHIIYMTPYIPGVRKSPRWNGQTKEKSIEFAKFFRTFTKERNISFLDPTELVRNLVSWDGTHYSAGLNDALIDILSTYLIKDL